MYCKNCGGEIPSNANFCSHCGAKIDFEDTFVNTDTVNERPEPKPDTSYFKETRRQARETGRANTAWYFLGFFCPIAGFILGYIYAYSKPDLAYKCRRGAWYGFIFDLMCILLELLLQLLV